MSEKIELAIEAINAKKSKMFFFIPDTDGNTTAGIKYLFDVAKAFRDTGYQVFLFHEKAEFKNPLGQHYESLEFVSFKQMNSNKKYLMGAGDFVFVSELYVQGLVSQMRESKIPSCVVVVSQAYDYIFQAMDIGFSWDMLGIEDVLTTSNSQAEFIRQFMPTLDIQVVNPFVEDYFRPSSIPSKPFVAIVSRFATDGDKLIKQFYLKYPLFSWIPFKALGQMSQKDFAKELSECACAVWLDEPSAFGTFPLECLSSGVPLVAHVPSMVPEYAIEGNKLSNNITWCVNKLSMVDELATLVDGFLHNTLGTPEFVNPYDKKAFDSQILEYIKKITTKRINTLNTLKSYDDNSNTDSQAN